MHWSYIATVNQHHCFFGCYSEFSLENLASVILFLLSHHHCTFSRAVIFSTGWFSTVCRFHLYSFSIWNKWFSFRSFFFCNIYVTRRCGGVFFRDTKTHKITNSNKSFRFYCFLSKRPPVAVRDCGLCHNSTFWHFFLLLWMMMMVSGFFFSTLTACCCRRRSSLFTIIICFVAISEIDQNICEPFSWLAYQSANVRRH